MEEIHFLEQRFGNLNKPNCTYTNHDLFLLPFFIFNQHFAPRFLPVYKFLWFWSRSPDPDWMTRIWAWVRAYSENRNQRRVWCRKWRNRWNSMATSSSSSWWVLHRCPRHLGCFSSSSGAAFLRSLPLLRRRGGGRRRSFWWWAAPGIGLLMCFCCWSFGVPFSVVVWAKWGSFNSLQM